MGLNRDKIRKHEGPFTMRYRGIIFESPFHCLCCGLEISEVQFSFGRACGYCDCGRCVKGFGYEPGHGDLWEVLRDGTIAPRKGWQ